MRWRENWPAILFIIALAMAAFMPHIIAFPGICSDDEGVLECAREWVNASGQLLAFAVATVAARFAYGQFIASKQQAEIASLPSLDKRLQSLHALSRLAGNAAFQMGEIVSRGRLVEQHVGRSIEEHLNPFTVTFTAFGQALSAINETYEKVQRLKDELGDDAAVAGLANRSSDFIFDVIVESHQLISEYLAVIEDSSDDAFECFMRLETVGENDLEETILTAKLARDEIELIIKEINVLSSKLHRRKLEIYDRM
jgi:hypothetical protein